MSRKIDWVRSSRRATASRRLARRASARSRMSAIRRCSSIGGLGTLELLQFERGLSPEGSPGGGGHRSARVRGCEETRPDSLCRLGPAVMATDDSTAKPVDLGDDVNLCRPCRTSRKGHAACRTEIWLSRTRPCAMCELRRCRAISLHILEVTDMDAADLRQSDCGECRLVDPLQTSPTN